LREKQKPATFPPDFEAALPLTLRLTGARRFRL